jgi:hypothetical protein
MHTSKQFRSVKQPYANVACVIGKMSQVIVKDKSRTYRLMLREVTKVAR